MHFSGNFAKLLYICSNDRARTESLLNDVRVCSLADYEKDKIGRIPTDTCSAPLLTANRRPTID